jgi:hypothetical protein
MFNMGFVPQFSLASASAPHGYRYTDRIVGVLKQVGRRFCFADDSQGGRLDRIGASL